MIKGADGEVETWNKKIRLERKISAIEAKVRSFGSIILTATLLELQTSPPWNSTV